MKELMKQNHVMSANTITIKRYTYIWQAHIYGNDTSSPI